MANSNSNNNNNYDSDSDSNWFSETDDEKVNILTPAESRIAALFAKEIEQVKDYPAGYTDIDVMRELLPELKSRNYTSYRTFIGIPWKRSTRRNDNIEYLSDLIPELVDYVDEEFNKRMMREKEEDIKIIISEKDSPRKTLPRRHISNQ